MNNVINASLTIADSLPNQIHKHARDNARGIACRDGEVSVNWWNFSSAVNRIANQLLSMNIGKGKRVCVLGRNSLTYCKVMAGILTSGACFIPAPTMINKATLSAILQDAQPDLLLLDEEFLPLLDLQMDRDRKSVV